MNDMPGSSPLLLTNVLLAALVLGSAAAVVGGAVYEVWTRRRLRRSLPDHWPPTPEAQDVRPPAGRARRVRS